jgi:hypothetical protein
MSLRAALKLRCQQGFTTVTLMGVLAVGGLLVAAGFAAVDGDTTLTRQDQDYKQSYGAAEGGLQWYLNRMGQDNSFYVRCTNVPRPNATEYAPVNQRWNGAGGDPRVWRSLPGEQAAYTVELVPAPGYSACLPNNQYSMVDPNGNMTLRVTGRSRGEFRTVLATLRRANFIDFIYFTDFETLDPSAYPTAADTSRATTECSRYRPSRTSFCVEIQFTASDAINGPFHTNDNLQICGGATFGRTPRDLIEISGSPRWINGGCTANPHTVGTLVHPASQLALPPSNAALETVVQPAYKFKGRTRIQLNGASMTVTTGYDVGNVTTTTMPLPSNGVIYVDNSLSGSCSAGFVRTQTYSGTGRGASTSCGNAWISGTYSSDLTIGADNDVIVEGDVARADDGVLLGLIANNFVRVYHPVTFGSGPGNPACTNTGDTGGRRIDAAILALQHSFIHDNWYCGAPTGDVNVYGAIAQKFRGPVGTGSGATITTGFRKSYVYNDRLRYREPPYFLDPVQASWRIARETEQVPAVKP